MTLAREEPVDAIAIVGMAGRFPGAGTVDDFWALLRDGRSGIRTFTSAELLASGVEPELVSMPGYVPVKGVVDGIEEFDAGLFGMTPREASLTDPQHRVLLECAWEALERAGYAGPVRPGPVGVWAAIGHNTYLPRNLMSHPDLAAAGDAIQTVLANDHDHAALRVSYKLDLRGPSLAVQTACSGSLVAVHLACQSLLAGECDLALAGGACLTVPVRAGALHQEGGIYSPDGVCRAFDAGANGTVGGNGAGVVVLRRLAEALAAGDHVHAVIRGSAINNDGAAKVGYTAPSVPGQAAVIRAALALADVPASSVSYVEAHGTGTPLGDPIEVAALNRAFDVGPERRGTCALGSVKASIGHLDAAAGVAGLIKTALALERREIPPSLNYTAPNPAIDFDAGPFHVSTRLTAWPEGPTPRRAGVSSFGLGGTNAHVVLEEAPAPTPTGPGRTHALVPVSARSAAALEVSVRQLSEHLAAHAGEPLADVAFTLATGRRAFPFRRAFVCDAASAASALAGSEAASGETEGGTPVAFLFPGQAALPPGAVAELYRSEPVFRREIDRCCDALSPRLDLDLRAALVDPDAVGAADALGRTHVLQPALFTVEIALARLLETWGARPVAVLGHSLGEYVAACVAGVFELDDALTLVAERGRLMQALPPGRMLAVPLAPESLEPRLSPLLSLAAVNGPQLSVVSGPEDAVDGLARELGQERVAVLRLTGTYGFHSPLVAPAQEPFGRAAAAARPRAPRLPCLSGPSGDWLRPEEATDPGYWARQMRETVRFGPGLGRLLAEHPRLVLLEVGPGQALSAAALRHPDRRPSHAALPVVGRLGDAGGARALHGAVARAWVAGLDWDWNAYHAAYGPRARVPLPTYPFEKRRCWVDPAPRSGVAAGAPTPSPRPVKIGDPDLWLHVPGWRRAPALGGRAPIPVSWLLFLDGSASAVRAAEALARAGHTVIRREAAGGSSPARVVEQLAEQRGLPERIVLFGGAGASPRDPAGGAFADAMRLARALARHGPASGLELTYVAAGLFDVTGAESLDPDAASVLGVLRALPQEHPGTRTRAIDVEEGGDGGEALAAELAIGAERLLALRGGRRWVPDFRPLDPGPRDGGLVRPGGVFLVIGGLGGVGLDTAAFLARRSRGSLVLLSRRELPDPATWDAHLSGGDASLAARIRGVRRLRELGARVDLLAGDATDPAALGRTLSHAESAFGGLHGVVWAAGAPIVEHPIRDSVRVEWERQLKPKRLGLAALESALGDRPLDFCLVSSSLSAVLGKAGFAAYGAAHDFADAFVARHNRGPGPEWRVVDWDNWITSTAEAEGIRAAPTDLALTSAEAERVLERVLSAGTPVHLAVSTGDLQARLRTWVDAIGNPVADRAPAPGAPAEAPAVAGPAHPRPALSTPYAAPVTPEERLLAEVWAETFGLAEVGLHDGFFDLGGDSLLCLQLVARAATRGLKISPRDVYDHQTIALLSASRTAAPVRPALRPFHFGDPEAPLYGCLHEPAGKRRRQGVLICQPLAHEHVQFHRACVQLATRLAERGFPTLRFDYHGCGDSGGETGAGGIERWRADVALAGAELRRASGASELCLVGVRLGASLAMLAAEDDPAAGVVLWDPVVSGATYLAELRALQGEVRRRSHVRERPTPGDVEELVGFPYPRALREDLERLDLTRLASRPAPRALVLFTRPEPSGSIGDLLARLGTEWSAERLPNPGLWVWMEDVSRQIVRQEALHAVSDWLERGFA